MPYYRITVELKNGKKYGAVKLLEQRDIDLVYIRYKKKADDFFYPHQVKSFDVVMLSKHSTEVYRKK